MVDNIDITPPKYGPGDFSAELYKMIRGIPAAYEEGSKAAFERGQRARTEELQKPILGPDGKPETDPEAIARELARRDPTKALEYPTTALTLKATQEWFANRNKKVADFPTAGEDTGERRTEAGTGEPIWSVSDIVNRSGAQISDPKAAAANIARLYDVDPNDPLPPEKAASIRTLLDRSTGGGGATPETAPAMGAASLDPRTAAPPNRQPGVLGGPPTLVGGAPARAPAAPYAAPLQQFVQQQP